MLFEDLATELVNQIFHSCTSIADVIALSSTCHRFRHIYASSQKLVILQHATEAEFGPLSDAVQLITHNTSQPAHLFRTANLSMALLKEIIRHGRVANKWADLYPFKKWKHDFENRRLLTNAERYLFRRALYRLWLYTRAFHNQAHPRTTRNQKLVLQERASLLHNWSTPELSQIADVHTVLREVVHSNICPSNGTIARKFKKRFPDLDHSHQLLFNIHLNYPPPHPTPTFNSEYHSMPTNHALSQFSNAQYQALSNGYNRNRFTKFSVDNAGAEGWGDDISHYYVVEDMLKLDPEQLLLLRETRPTKFMIELYLKGLGDWFENNGETWGQTLAWVLGERGEEVEEVLEAVREGEAGIAVLDD